MNLDTLPRTAVRVTVAAYRLPVVAAGTLLGHRTDTDWAPVLVFDATQAQVKETLGALLRDDVLEEEGRLIAARVTKLRQATQLEDLAEKRRSEADSELADARSRAAQQRQRAAATAAERKQRAAADAKAARQATDEAAARKAELVDQASAEARAAVQRQARRERAAALTREEAALQKDAAASAKVRKAKAADTRIAASKRKRSAN